MDLTVIPAKLNRLIKELSNLGLDPEPNNYNLLGIQWLDDNDLLNFDKRLDKNIRNNIILRADVPEITTECICKKQDIKYNCIIRHLTENNVMTIGICCYKAMTNRNRDARKQMCTFEGCNERHSNIKYTVCNTHKKVLIATLKRQEKEEEEARREAERAEMKLQEEIKSLGERPFGFGRRFRSTPIKDVPDWYVDWLDRENIWNNQVSDLWSYRLFQYYRNIQ